MEQYSTVHIHVKFIGLFCTQDQRPVSFLAKIWVLLHVFLVNSYRNVLTVAAKVLLLLVLLVPFALLIMSSAIQVLTATSVLPLTPATYLPPATPNTSSTSSNASQYQPLTLLTYLDYLRVYCTEQYV